MTTPQSKILQGGKVAMSREELGIAPTEEPALSDTGAFVSGETPLKCVAWDGGAFSLVEARRTALDRYGVKVTFEFEGIYAAHPHYQIYYPIDKRIIAEDVEGAIEAFANEAGDGWLFSHSSHEVMLDYEMELRSAVVATFANVIDLAQIKVNEATNATVKEQAVAQHKELASFRQNVTYQALVFIRNKHLGWTEQNSIDSHLYIPIREAVKKVADTWRAQLPTSWSKVSARITGIQNNLEREHRYETRWAQAARLAAAAKEQEQDG